MTRDSAIDDPAAEAFGAELRELIVRHVSRGLTSRAQMGCLAALLAEAVRGLVESNQRRGEAQVAFDKLWDHWNAALEKRSRA